MGGESLSAWVYVLVLMDLRLRSPKNISALSIVCLDCFGSFGSLSLSNLSFATPKRACNLIRLVAYSSAVCAGWRTTVSC